MSRFFLFILPRSAGYDKCFVNDINYKYQPIIFLIETLNHKGGHCGFIHRDEDL